MNSPPKQDKGLQSLSLLHKESLDVQEVAGGAFPPGVLFLQCNPSKDYAAPMSSPRGWREYFLAELIFCCEEIIGQSFPRTHSHGSGMVSQQGYFCQGKLRQEEGGENSGKNQSVNPAWEQGLENPPGFDQKMLYQMDWGWKQTWGTGSAGVHC